MLILLLLANHFIEILLSINLGLIIVGGIPILDHIFHLFFMLTTGLCHAHRLAEEEEVCLAHVLFLYYQVSVPLLLVPSSGAW
jgi:hypothetical protein